MLKIGPEQMQDIEAGYRRRRRKNLWRQLKISYPVLCRDIEDGEGVKVVGECIDNGKEFDIIRDEDVLRFSVLALLPKSVRQDDWFSSIVIRVLNNENLSAGDRLAFIFGNVVDESHLA